MEDLQEADTASSAAPSAMPVIHLRRVADRRLCEALLLRARDAGIFPPEGLAFEDEGTLRFLPLVGVASVRSDLDALARRLAIEARRCFNFAADEVDPWTLVALPSEVRRSRYGAIPGETASTLVCRVSLSRSRCVLDGRRSDAIETNLGDALIFSGALSCEEHAVGTKATSVVTVLRRH